ncbi:hypothetical protein DBR27_08900 [Flavobacterium sp. HMWF030]|nr:hypothetical protein DBR27_08900 [Flavobacterium sp. HMWF030]
MIKKYILFTLISLTLISCQKKEPKIESKIDELEFIYLNSLRIPYNEVKINISRMPNNDSALVFIKSRPANNNPQWSYSKIEDFTIIDLKTFKKLTDVAISLDKIDIDKAYLDGNDGSTWEIQFGSKGKNKNYRFWAPNSNTQQRGLSEFVNLCEQIVEVSKLKKEEILKD